MQLYGSPLSPFVRKILMVAAEKDIALELVPTAPFPPSPEFLKISPFGKIPAFRDGDFTISDSTAIFTYLEAKFPAPALLPADPAARARAVWFEEFSDTILVPAGGKVFFNRIVAPMVGLPADLAAADKAQAEELPKLYAYLEEQVPPGGGWLAGEALSIADIAVASPFVNMMHAGAAPDPASYPKLCAWVARWFERPCLKGWIEREKAMLAGQVGR